MAKKIRLAHVLTLSGTLMFGVLSVWSTEIDDESTRDLRAAVEELIHAAEARDDDRLDDVTCLDEFTRAYLQRKQALGLITDEFDESLQVQLKQQYRSAVYDLCDGLMRKGRELEYIDPERVRIYPLDEKANPMLLQPTDPEDTVSFQITGEGIVAVKLLTIERPIDIVTYRMGERWCLRPAPEE